MPAYRVKLRRGTTAEHANFIGAEGEVTVDTDKKRLVVHDGVTPGGHLVAALTDVNTDVDQFTDTEGLMGGYTWEHSSVTTSTAATSTVINYAVTVGQGYQYGTNGVYGNVFYLQNTTDDGTGNPVEATASASPAIELTAGYTYVFDVSHSSNSGHPLAFTTDGGSNPVTAGVTSDGTPGTAGATVTYIVPSPRPLNLQYYCTVHGTGMGNVITVRSDAYVATATVPSSTFAWGGDRGIIGGGEEASYSLTSEYISISTPGNSTNFGDLTVARMSLSACSDSTYGLWAGGISFTGSMPFNYWNVIDYLTFATIGNGSDFGDLTIGRTRPAACSDGTYGLFGAGEGGDGIALLEAGNVIDYVTIATPSSATDFGDHTFIGWGKELAAAADATYGLFAGGYVNDGTSSYNNFAIDYVTIATPGNALDFGDLTAQRTSGGRRAGGLSNDTYALFFGGTAGTDVIDYVTIATPGNATDFGNLTETHDGFPCGCSDNTYGVIFTSTGGGGTSAIGYVNISTPGDTTDFGNLGTDDHNRYSGAAASGNPS